MQLIIHSPTLHFFLLSFLSIVCYWFHCERNLCSPRHRFSNKLHGYFQDFGFFELPTALQLQNNSNKDIVNVLRATTFLHGKRTNSLIPVKLTSKRTSALFSKVLTPSNFFYNSTTIPQVPWLLESVVEFGRDFHWFFVVFAVQWAVFLVTAGWKVMQRFWMIKFDFFLKQFRNESRSGSTKNLPYLSFGC